MWRWQPSEHAPFVQAQLAEAKLKHEEASLPINADFTAEVAIDDGRNCYGGNTRSQSYDTGVYTGPAARVRPADSVLPHLAAEIERLEKLEVTHSRSLEALLHREKEVCVCLCVCLCVCVCVCVCVCMRVRWWLHILTSLPGMDTHS